MSKADKPQTLEDRAANALNFVMGGLILLAVTGIALLVFGDIAWRLPEILKLSWTQQVDEAMKAALALGATGTGLSLLHDLFRKAFPKKPAA